MRSIGIWFFLTCKRYLKKLSFLLILLALPAATFFIRRAERQKAQEIRIAVSVQGEKENSGAGELGENTSLEQMLLNRLVETGEKEENSLFYFYKCDSEEQLKEEVVTGKAECGYVISSGLRDKLDEKDFKRSILVYSSPSTVLDSLSTEVVFASLMELYGKEIFLDYISGQETVKEAAASAGVDNRQLEVQAEEIYDKWMGNGSTFRFQYRQIGIDESLADEAQQAISVFPVRGFVAVYLFITGLYSAVMLGLDEKKGLFLSLRREERRWCRGAVLAAPIFLAFLSGFAALASGGCLQGAGKEAGAMGAYFGAVCLFSYGLKAVCRKTQVMCCLIPLFLVGSLVFTPVFVDIGQFFPEFGWMGKLFLPFYYLRAF